MTDTNHARALLLFTLALLLVSCQPNTVEVAFTSDPENARIYINGSLAGRTPHTAELQPDTEYSYQLIASSPYDDYNLYKPFEGTLTTTDESTGVNVWLDRTTAEEQAEQIAEAEVERQRQAEEAERERERRAEEQARRQREAEERQRQAEERQRQAEEQRQRELEAKRIYYRLETNCGQGADLTFFNNNGDITQQSRRASGWYYGFVPSAGPYLSLSAQNNCDRGYETVKFTQGAWVIRENTSTGAYVIASISGFW